VVVSSRQHHTAPEHRNLGLIFQSYAVWPHMTVYENVAYGLRLKKVSAKSLTLRVRGVLEMLGLEQFEQRPATDLSGGQQQRVALARSIVTEPKVLLLDEPLSNLDAKLRERMRGELRSIQQRLGITAIFVTHDQIEAMAMADEIVVMRQGSVQQIGSPKTVYNEPANLFTANFIGECNVIEGRVASVDEDRCIVHANQGGFAVQVSGASDVAVGEGANMIIRPEDLVSVAASEAGRTNVIEGTVVDITYLSDHSKNHTRASGIELTISLPSKSQPFTRGSPIWLRVEPADVKFFRERRT
jgi:iron(III) transport system ATP-binding protein